MAYGWPSQDVVPVPLREKGRFAKAFPLEFPMGIADLYDEKECAWKLTAAEWVQHLMRYRTGQFVTAAGITVWSGRCRTLCSWRNLLEKAMRRIEW